MNQQPPLTWPRLLDIHLSAQYLGVGESTIRDYVADNILHPMELPGSTLRDRNGAIITHSKARKISKFLIDREDLDRLIDQRKAGVPRTIAMKLTGHRTESIFRRYDIVSQNDLGGCCPETGRLQRRFVR